MNHILDDEQYCTIVSDILSNEEFDKIKKINHHGITRYEHSLKVSYYAYRLAKTLKLNAVETARAGLLHDFFINSNNETKISKIVSTFTHPYKVVNTVSNNFKVSDRELDIIKTHMFPVTFTPPKYLESWIVDLIDDVASIYERGKTMKHEIKTAVSFAFVFLINYIKMH